MADCRATANVAVAEAAVAEEANPKLRANRMVVADEAPSTRIYRRETSIGAICILNLLKVHTFVQIRRLAHGKTSLHQDQKNEGLTSSTK